MTQLISWVSLVLGAVCVATYFTPSQGRAALRRCPRNTSYSYGGGRYPYYPYCNPYYQYNYNCYNPCYQWSTNPTTASPYWPTQPPHTDPTPPPTYRPTILTVTPRPTYIVPTIPTVNPRPTYRPIIPTVTPRPTYIVPIIPTATYRPTYRPIMPTVTPRPTYRPIMPTVRPRPTYRPIMPTKSPKPTYRPIMPTVNPRPTYRPIMPTVNPRPTYRPIMPTVNPRPTYRPIMPTVNPRPTYRPIMPTVNPRPTYRPIMPTVNPRPTYRPIMPTVTFYSTLPTPPPAYNKYIVKRGCNKMCKDKDGLINCCNVSTDLLATRRVSQRGQCPVQQSACVASPPPHQLCNVDAHCMAGHGCCYDRCRQEYACLPLHNPAPTAPTNILLSQPGQSLLMEPSASQNEQRRTRAHTQRSTGSADMSNEVGPRLSGAAWVEVTAVVDDADPAHLGWLTRHLLPLAVALDPHVDVHILPSTHVKKRVSLWAAAECARSHNPRASVLLTPCLLGGPVTSTTAVRKRVKQCAKKLDIKWDDLRVCLKTGEGSGLLREAQRRHAPLLQEEQRRHLRTASPQDPLLALHGVVVDNSDGTADELTRQVCGALGGDPTVRALCTTLAGTVY